MLITDGITSVGRQQLSAILASCRGRPLGGLSRRVGGHHSPVHGMLAARKAHAGQALMGFFSSLLAILMRRGLAFSATGMESRRTPLW